MSSGGPSYTWESQLTSAPGSHHELELFEEPIELLPQLDEIPISFEVRAILEVVVEGAGLSGIQLVETEVHAPYVKDYDADSGGGPSRLSERFDVSKWGLISVRIQEDPVGGCVIAWDTPGAFLLEDRRDLAVMWDLRVRPEFRGMGLGTRLFEAAEVWAGERGCRQLKVETQNINLPASRFYAARGCVLGGINRFAYPTLPGEIQLLWYKVLRPEE